MRNREACLNMILAYLRAGSSVSSACQSVELARATFYRWRADPAIKRRVREAEARGAMSYDGLITARNDTNSQADWLVSPRYPKAWGSRSCRKIAPQDYPPPPNSDLDRLNRQMARIDKFNGTAGGKSWASQKTKN